MHQLDFWTTFLIYLIPLTLLILLGFSFYGMYTACKKYVAKRKFNLSSKKCVK